MGVAIRQAGESDRADLVRLMDAAFAEDPVSAWIFPDRELRRRHHARFMALWMSDPGTPDAGQDEDDSLDVFRQAAGPGHERAGEVVRLLGEIHPQGVRHEHLWMIAVSPQCQGRGVGRALIEPVLERCDRDGAAVYLEASSARSRRLYERLLFSATGTVLELPDGPRMWPMWREPRTTVAPDGGAATP
jgi:ribosomal protein S18 acetylase RimI-like enzyme